MKIFKTILVVIFLIFMVSMLWIYWFTGFGDVQLSKSALQDSNFSINLTSDNMQFYENLRYSDSKISYHISDKCTLQKKADAERAFEILENKTILDFYPVNSNEEILITCESKEKIKEDYFVAGEGGPVNISRAGQFNVIYTGQILLIRQSECPNPNIALHEILHALGFGHSSNKNNIMYEISECSQTLGDDIPRFIDELYSIPSHPDLAFEEVIPLVLYHHERYDGNGYPEGLKGEGIPIIAAIIAVADTFDAMTSDRPYRPALADDAALAELQKCAGAQFDPQCVKGFAQAYHNGLIVSQKNAAGRNNA